MITLHTGVNFAIDFLSKGHHLPRSKLTYQQDLPKGDDIHPYHTGCQMSRKGGNGRNDDQGRQC
ncbi:MAG: hypothetical protein HW380_1149 [Magnetococcales bacterium]|nr:hypothetical protein [Magnetococcales bacterium]